MEPLELYLIHTESQEFKAIVSRSSVGEGEIKSSLPFFEGEKNWLMPLLRCLNMIAFKSESFQQDEQEWMFASGILDENRHSFSARYLIKIGEHLYTKLFPADSPVKNVLLTSLRLHEAVNSQLHIQLKFGSSAQDVRLADYPWELLHDGTSFLLHRDVIISRSFALSSVPPKLPPTDKINVLLLSSNASDGELELEKLGKQEAQAIYQGLEKARNDGHINVVQLEEATRDKLRTYLTEHRREDAPQVLHFDGHGIFGKYCSGCRTMHKGNKIINCRKCSTKLPEARGYLLFEDGKGGPDYVSPEELGVLISISSRGDSNNKSGGIALVVLSACQSAMTLEGDSVFNGIAQNLIDQRIPSVVAMQYTVSVASATKFAEQFYRSLGQKNSLGIVVSQAREAMGINGNQWYRPVLYLRWQDNEGGQLFDLGKPKERGQLFPPKELKGAGVKSQKKYSGQVKNLICQKFTENWEQLADYFEIELQDRKTFSQGKEVRRIWEWLEERDRLSELENAFIAIGRHDLVEELKKKPDVETPDDDSGNPANTIKKWREFVENNWYVHIGKGKFVEDQKILLLEQDGTKAFQHLKIGSNRAGRQSERESQLDTGNWKSIDRDKILHGMQSQDESLHRIVVTADGGVGKTANLRWLWNAWHSKDEKNLAFHYEASELPNPEDQWKGKIEAWKIDDLEDYYLGQLAEKLLYAEIERNADNKNIVKAAAKCGKLLLIVDGLDQSNNIESLSLLTKFLEKMPNCRAVLGGRLYAINQYKKELALETTNWKFIRIDVFSEENQKALLGPDATKYLDRIPKNVRPLMAIPRVLLLLEKLSENELLSISSDAYIFWRAATRLIYEGLETSITTKQIGSAMAVVEKDQVNYIHALLGALAYTMTDQEGFDNTKIEVDDEFKKKITELICRNEQYKEAEVEKDLNCLAGLGNLIEHPFFEQKPSKLLANVIWESRTFQEFYTAHWLAKYAGNEEEEQFEEWIFFPEILDLDEYYYINRFLAEMPSAASKESSWVLLASNWYKPEQPRRSSEMLYRSWEKMIDFARFNLNDWWDVCYEKLQSPKKNRSRSKLTPAQKTLIKFRSEFQKILDQEQSTNALGPATEFINNEHWTIIQGGLFNMGMSQDNQGFPSKTKAYWLEQLQKVGELKNRYQGNDLREEIEKIAKQCMREEWYYGKQGNIFRTEEVKNLTDTFLLSHEQAFGEIENQWRTRDEEPKENPQEVKPFAIHAFPILNQTFRLFYRCHDQVQKEYLNGKIPQHDLPVTYVSWYDCWAFCQWACWQDRDQNIDYQCRLPHEPEWEFAAKGCLDGNFPENQRYWWGDNFYIYEDSGKIEYLSTKEAYAHGEPGKTRSPKEATPNGFGLYDILGNVWEWMANSYEKSYSRKFPENVQNKPAINCDRVMRGGLWYFLDLLATCTNRFRLKSDDRDYKMGFRVIREITKNN